MCGGGGGTTAPEPHLASHSLQLFNVGLFWLQLHVRLIHALQLSVLTLPLRPRFTPLAIVATLLHTWSVLVQSSPIGKPWVCSKLHAQCQNWAAYL